MLMSSFWRAWIGGGWTESVIAGTDGAQDNEYWV